MSCSANLQSTNSQQPRRPRILLGVTGSVAAVKAPELAGRLSRQYNMDVRILLTRGGRNFWDKAKDYDVLSWNILKVQMRYLDKKRKTEEIMVGSITTAETTEETEKDLNEQRGTIELHDADEEWKDWNRMGDPVLHIELRDWADVFVIAPLSAHSLAKLAHGLCDDTLSCVARAWDFGHGSRPGKPLIIAPAMNTAMWEHPLTQQQLATIKGFWNIHVDRNDNPNGGVTIVSPQVKTLACGEVGNGAMASVDDILEAVKGAISMQQ